MAIGMVDCEERSDEAIPRIAIRLLRFARNDSENIFTLHRFGFSESDTDLSNSGGKSSDSLGQSSRQRV